MFTREVTDLSFDTDRCILVIVGEDVVDPASRIRVHDWLFEPCIPVGATCSVSPTAHFGVIASKTRACVGGGEDWARRQLGFGGKPAAVWELLCLHGGFTITSRSCMLAVVELGVSISLIG